MPNMFNTNRSGEIMELVNRHSTRRAFMGLCAGLALLAGIGPLATPAKAENAYDFTFQAIEGGALPLSQYKGKAVLVVNTASMCGYTPQYKSLETLWEKYRDKGLVVVGVPSNDFGGQEPGSDKEIKEFCNVNFAIDFPMTTKEPVKGAQAHPFYKWVPPRRASRSGISTNICCPPTARWWQPSPPRSNLTTPNSSPLWKRRCPRPIDPV
jgi:glutathione peroxidase